MKRRTFIRNSALAAGGLFFQSHQYTNQTNYEIAILRGGSPVEMLELGLEALGNIERFVKKGQKILVKPTMRWNMGPESGANTNPDLLAHLVQSCYKAGSIGVYLVDHTEDSWTKCYKNSGIERAVKDAGAKILPGNKEFLYQQVDIPNAKVLKTAKIHEIVQEVDIIINVPAVKRDPQSGIFGAFNNLMGLVWDHESYQNQSDECLIDFLHYRKPILNIMDAYRVAQSDNNNQAGPEIYKSLIISPDIVAAEVYAAKRLGIDPKTVKHIELAAKAGFGQINLPKESARTIVLKNSHL